MTGLNRATAEGHRRDRGKRLSRAPGTKAVESLTILIATPSGSSLLPIRMSSRPEPSWELGLSCLTQLLLPCRSKGTRMPPSPGVCEEDDRVRGNSSEYRLGRGCAVSGIEDVLGRNVADKGSS